MTYDVLTVSQYDAMTAEQYDTLGARPALIYDVLTDEQYDTMIADEYDVMAASVSMPAPWHITAIVSASGLAQQFLQIFSEIFHAYGSADMQESEVFVGAGCSIKLLPMDCDGARIHSEACSRITYTIHRIEMGHYIPVSGHTDVDISPTAISAAVMTDGDTGSDYTTDILISAAVALPFPTHFARYFIDIKFYDLAGEPVVYRKPVFTN